MGVDSTYKIYVGRSADIRGPYVDHDGVALLSGGGTPVVVGDDRWKGPGHNAVLHTAVGDYNVYHSYDAQASRHPDAADRAAPVVGCRRLADLRRTLDARLIRDPVRLPRSCRRRRERLLEVRRRLR